MESIKDMHVNIKDQLVINGQKVTRFHLFEPKEGHPGVKVFAGAYDIPGHYESPGALLKAFPKHFKERPNPLKERLYKTLDEVKEAGALFNKIVGADSSDMALFFTLTGYDEELTAVDITLQFSTPDAWASYTFPTFAEPCTVNDPPAKVMGAIIDPMPIDGEPAFSWNKGAHDVEKEDELTEALRESLGSLMGALYTALQPLESWKLTALTEAGLSYIIE